MSYEALLAAANYTVCHLLFCCLLQDLLSAGKGQLQHRDTESGQILIDLVRHADVAELALWINTFGDSIYKAVWGDKDTYALAFAVAGKAHEFTQIQVSVMHLSWKFRSSELFTGAMLAAAAL